MLVQALLQMGQPARAKDILQPLLDRGMPTNPRVLLFAGETFLANGDVQRAMAFYRAAAQGAGAYERVARTRLGQIALATGRGDEGIEELELASELDADAYQAELSLVAGHLSRKDFDKALESVRALEKKQPKNPLTFQMFGLVNLTKGDSMEARKNFEKALELAPTYLPAAQSLAGLDIVEKRPEEARKRFETMIAREPGNEQLYLALAEVQARTGATTKEIDATLQRAVSSNPRAVAGWVALVNLRLRSGEFKAALAAAQDAQAVLPAEPRVLDVAGAAREAAGEINQAVETYNRLAAVQPTAVQPLFRLAALHMRQNETDKAIETLRRAQKIAPRGRDVVPLLVEVYVASGRHDEALKEARALQKREPKYGGGYALEADVHLAQRNYAEAERLYREALKLEPRANIVAIKLHGTLAAAGKSLEADAWGRKWIAANPRDVRMRLYLGGRELAAANLKASASHYRAVVGIDASNAEALNNLAWIGGQTDDPKALDYAERAAGLEPNNASVLDTYGMLLVKKGETEKGLALLQRARYLAPARNELRLNYAKALISAGKKDDARKELVALQGVKENFAGKQEVAGLLKGL
jgi:putative PEP-CTERM system TPR-repeat lipoprotein